ncbi:DUF3040 domain-containing protein [Kitasatospora sp. NPDC048540]|uniref:DUF3040 domain-containing protein n=1 Tax=unclassified Kitasatospora TaxID=2633591 RepID=UPI00053B97B9|nr:DUF3040 domain-containing protein [Kitasatospora sp. MBT63]
MGAGFSHRERQELAAIERGLALGDRRLARCLRTGRIGLLGLLAGPTTTLLALVVVAAAAAGATAAAAAQSLGVLARIAFMLWAAAVGCALRLWVIRHPDRPLSR